MQGLDAPCSFCTNQIILEKKPEPYRWEYYNPMLDRHYAIVDRIIRWPDGRDVRFEMAIDITMTKIAEKLMEAKNMELEQLIYISSHGLRSPLVKNELVQQLSLSFAYRLKEAGIQLIVEDLPPCRGDAKQLTQVFANLLDNAMKYLDTNRPGMIKKSGSVEANRSIYRVEDNGIGIAENHLEKVFELFHRMSPGNCEGEGLGLTMARQVLSRMDGEINVESKLGEGSVFIVSLPCVIGQMNE